jgi:catechol 2,3-dioxygenase
MGGRVRNSLVEFPNFTVGHVGLFVFDIDLMVDFFTRTCGLHITDQSVVRQSSRVVFLSRDPAEHHQIVLVEGRTSATELKLLNQISLRVRTVDDLRDAMARLEQDPRVTEIDPCNHGNAFSVYFRDPERNRFELYLDSPFYVKQAVLAHLDLQQTDAQLIASTQARHAADPSFRLVEQWRTDFAKKLGRSDDPPDDNGG